MRLVARLPARSKQRSSTKRAESRAGSQVDEIVELRRGEAEGRMPLRPVADHAVGGVDRLIANATRQAAERKPEGGRDDTVGKILGEALDGRAGDACLIEALRRRGRRFLPPPARPASNPASSASATARTCASRLRCAMRLDAISAVSGEADGARKVQGGQRKAEQEWRRPQTIAKSKRSARNPRARRAAKERASWFKQRSVSAIRRPIQVTG